MRLEVQQDGGYEDYCHHLQGDNTLIQNIGEYYQTTPRHIQKDINIRLKFFDLVIKLYDSDILNCRYYQHYYHL